MENDSNGSSVIIVDQREKASGLIDLLLRESSLQLRLQSLAYGDIIIGPIGIERKTAPDFLSSLKDGRLFSQLIGLRQYYRKRILILEGHSQLDDQLREHYALRGAFLRVAAGLQVPVLRTLSMRETVRVVVHLATQEKKKALIPTLMSRNLRKPAHGGFQQEYVLSGIRMIGRERAKLLLKHYGTLRAVFCASLESLLKVPGIGPKQAEILYQIANEEVRPILDETPSDDKQINFLEKQTFLVATGKNTDGL